MFSKEWYDYERSACDGIGETRVAHVTKMSCPNIDRYGYGLISGEQKRRTLYYVVRDLNAINGVYHYSDIKIRHSDFTTILNWIISDRCTTNNIGSNKKKIIPTLSDESMYGKDTMI